MDGSSGRSPTCSPRVDWRDTDAVASPQSLADYLWHWQDASPDRAFASDSAEQRYSYGETAAHVDALSAELARRGVVAGDRVAIVGENSSAWIIAFLAAIAAGAIAVPLATRLTPDELDLMLDDADPAVIAVESATQPLLSARWSGRLLQLGDQLPRGEQPAARTNGDAAACLTYTSGTTSRPKGVLLSNAALTRASETYAALFQSTPAMHTIVAVPLCHNTGFVDQLGHALVVGGSIENLRRFHADHIAEALQHGTCTYFIGVPTMYHRIVEHLAGSAAEWRGAVVGVRWRADAVSADPEIASAFPQRPAGQLLWVVGGDQHHPRQLRHDRQLGHRRRRGRARHDRSDLGDGRTAASLPDDDDRLPPTTPPRPPPSSRTDGCEPATWRRERKMGWCRCSDELTT